MVEKCTIRQRLRQRLPTKFSAPLTFPSAFRLEPVPRKACGDFCRALCRPTLSKMARNRTVRQSVRQRLTTKWAEQMVLGQALPRQVRLGFPPPRPAPRSSLARRRRHAEYAKSTYLQSAAANNQTGLTSFGTPLWQSRAPVSCSPGHFMKLTLAFELLTSILCVLQKAISEQIRNNT